MGTVVICLIQSYAVTVWAHQIPNAVTIPKVSYTIIAMITVTTGTMFLMWIGEQITKRGIGNGISLLIFAGIVARLPSAVWELVTKVRNRELNPVFVIVVFVMFVAVVALVVLNSRDSVKSR